MDAVDNRVDVVNSVALAEDSAVGDDGEAEETTLLMTNSALPVALSESVGVGRTRVEASIEVPFAPTGNRVRSPVGDAESVPVAVGKIVVTSAV